MTRNEKTGARVARIAAKVLAMKTFEYGFSHRCHRLEDDSLVEKRLWRDIRALAASALTQSPNRPKRKARGARNAH